MDEEVQRLPERYRAVLVLCALEGKSYEAAARELGCPRGTVAVRLLRARYMLKRRLVKRGLIAAAGALVAGSGVSQALAIVPQGLAAATAASAAAVATGAALLGVVSASVAALVNSATRQMWLEKCKTVILVLAGLGLTGAGTGAGARAGLGRLAPWHPPASQGVAASQAAPDGSVIDRTNRGGAMVLDGPGMHWELNPARK
jgi:hypothetical protein